MRSASIKMREKPSSKVFYWLIFLFFALISLLIIWMLVWGFVTSLKSPDDFNMNNNVLGFPSLDPNDPNNSLGAFLHWDNYQNILQHFVFEKKTFFYSGSKLIGHQTTANIGLMFYNTILYAGVGGFIYAMVPAIVAYLCAKFDYRFSHIVFVTFTLMLCIPIVGSYPTEITFLRNTGMYDTFWGNWLQKTGGEGMYFFVYYAFFKSQSNVYREEAEIDGASETHIMWRIYMPMAIKIIGTVFLIQFVSLWNDFQTPELYLPTHPTLAYGVYELTLVSSNAGDLATLNNVPCRMAACMVLALPITVIFIIFKNRLMGDITLGGIKE